MKLLHIADLHIGKRVNGMSMIPEQEHAIGQLAALAVDQGVAAVLIAGDVFDRTVPSREALETCERLFKAFYDEQIPLFVIPGNHDAPQQLAFCSELMGRSGLHVAKAFDGQVESHELQSGDERVRIHLLPFVRPTDVRMALPELASDIATHEDAVRAALSTASLDASAANVLIAHQFVSSGARAPETCDSETMNVGGADNVDVSAFDAFDYVALGHLHGAQQVGRPSVRYAGSPIKYSFSEVGHEKGATIVDITGRDVSVEHHELSPVHDMREIRASYEQLKAGVDTGDHLDYMRVTLTDASLLDAMAKLRVLYPNILRLDWEQPDEQLPSSAHGVELPESASPLELFESYYDEQVGEPLSSDQLALLSSSIERSVL